MNTEHNCTLLEDDLKMTFNASENCDECGAKLELITDKEGRTEAYCATCDFKFECPDDADDIGWDQCLSCDLYIAPWFPWTKCYSCLMKGD
jgi:hypothetical protein